MRDPERAEPDPDAMLDVVGPGVGGAQIVAPGLTPSTFDEPELHENTEDVDKSTLESIEGDTGLLEPNSPEFERLTKPVREVRRSFPGDDRD
jgi:hypothetical protein